MNPNSLDFMTEHVMSNWQIIHNKARMFPTQQKRDTDVVLTKKKT